MGDFQVEGGELKKLIKVAKKGPISFGYNPGKSEEDAYLGMHRSKAPAMLGKEAKETGEGGKFTFGTATVSGKILSLTCERDLPGMAKKLKKYLKSQKVMLNVQIMDADGNIVDSDIEEGLPDDPELEGDTDADEEPTGEVESEEGPEAAPVVDQAQLMKRLTALRDQITQLPAETQAKVMGPFRQVVDMVKAGQLPQAEQGTDKLEAVMRQLANAIPPAPPPPPTPDPQLAKLAQLVGQMRQQAEGLGDERTRTALLAALEKAAGHLRTKEVEQAVAIVKKVQEILKAQAGQQAPVSSSPTTPSPQSETQPEEEGREDDGEEQPNGDKAEWERRYAALENVIFGAMSQGLVEDVAQLRVLNNFATGSAADGAYDKALATLPRIEAMIEAGRADGLSAFEAEVPVDAKPFAKARVEWAQARTRMRGEVAKLISAIVAAAANDDLLEDAAANVSVLTGNVESLDERLESKLDEIVNAQADSRDKLKQEARDLITQYQAELSTPFFQDVDQSSGFASVAITSTAKAALGSIASVLA